MRIVLYTMSMEQGGAQRVAGLLARGLAKRDIDVVLVLDRAIGPFLMQIPKQIRVFDLKLPSSSLGLYGSLNYFLNKHCYHFDLNILSKLCFLIRQYAGVTHTKWLRYLSYYAFRAIKLSDYLRLFRPNAIISMLTEWNINTLLTKLFLNNNIKYIISEHTYLPVRIQYHPIGELVILLVKWFYPKADKIVTVSYELEESLKNFLSIPNEKIKTIYNPVVTPELFEQAKQPVSHPWFEQNQLPVILAVGRLTKAKDYPTLFRAFSLVRQVRPAKLLILGEGEERANLERLAIELGIQNDVSMPGFFDNPFAFMAKASVFVLSSAWEALPTVLVEALACGCPVVATDCRSGPREILDNGRYGRLVPVGDHEALAKAILETLDNPDFPADRQTRLQRAMEFSVDAAVDKYLKVLLD